MIKLLQLFYYPCYIKKCNKSKVLKILNVSRLRTSPTSNSITLNIQQTSFTLKTKTKQKIPNLPMCKNQPPYLTSPSMSKLHNSNAGTTLRKPMTYASVNCWIKQEAKKQASLWKSSIITSAIKPVTWSESSLSSSIVKVMDRSLDLSYMIKSKWLTGKKKDLSLLHMTITYRNDSKQNAAMSL